MNPQEIKERIIGRARSLGVNLIRTCTVQKWEEIPLQPREFWPQSICTIRATAFLTTAPTALPIISLQSWDCGRFISLAIVITG